jgi:hypothetical protein
MGVYIGLETGEFSGALWNSLDPGALYPLVGVRNAAQGWSYNKYVRNATGRTTELTNSSDGYDPTLRPWYVGAKAAQGPFWTDVYNFSDGTSGITFGRPLYRPTRTSSRAAADFIGVIGVDVTLADAGNVLEMEVTERFAGAFAYILVHGVAVAAVDMSEEEDEAYQKVRDYEAQLGAAALFGSDDSMYTKILASATPLTDSRSSINLTMVTAFPMKDFRGALNASIVPTAVFAILVLPLACSSCLYCCGHLP